MGTGDGVLAHLQRGDIMTDKRQRILTVEQMRQYLKACEWGDVPDKAQALVAYLVMDGYVLPPPAKENRTEQQTASYARAYGNIGYPKEPGYYWARWMTASPGTPDGDELTPSAKWEIVHVDHNFLCDADPKHPEYWLVSVPGVSAAQFGEQFLWGPRVEAYGAISAKVRTAEAKAKTEKTTRMFR